MIDCCRHVSAEKPAISRTRLQRSRASCPRRNSAGQRTRAYTAIPRPDTYCAMTVAAAAPSTPKPRPATNHRSSAMFSTAETARKTSGAAEFPMARSTEAKKL